MNSCLTRIAQCERVRGLVFAVSQTGLLFWKGAGGGEGLGFKDSSQGFSSACFLEGKDRQVSLERAFRTQPYYPLFLPERGREEPSARLSKISTILISIQQAYSMTVFQQGVGGERKKC